MKIRLLDYRCARILTLAVITLSFAGASAFAARPKENPCAGSYAQKLALLSTEEKNQIVLERFHTPLGQVTDALRTRGKFKDKFKAMKERDTRKQLFRLEELFRIYSLHPKFGDELAPWRDFVTKFEDYLGWTIDGKRMLKKAIQLKASPKKIRNLEKKAEKIEGKLRDYLRDGGWLGTRPKGEVKRMLAALGSIEWPSPADDREYIARHLSATIRRIQKKSYDMEELEDGIHELRRNLRSFLLKIQALRGKVVYGPRTGAAKSNAALKRLIDSAEKSGSKAPSLEAAPGVTATIVIPEDLADAMSGLVANLGEIKDSGEVAETLTKGDLSEQIENAKEVFKDLEESDLLNLLLKSLEKTDP